MATILRMLLSACGEVSDVGDEEDDGLWLSQLIDQRCHEVFGRQLESPINVQNFDVTSGLIICMQLYNGSTVRKTSSSAAAERPREPLSQLKSCQLLHNCTKNHI